MPYTRLHSSLVLISALAASGLAWMLLAQTARPDQSQLWHYRNLGKAFYENPTTQRQAVDEFKKALALAPDSVRERVNYGLALLRAGDVSHGIEELQKVQKTDPKLPHTWFNLGITLKKQGDLDAALAQFEGMAKLVPDEPITHYQMASILKARGDQVAAVKEFVTARRLDPRLAAPHFQLYGLYPQLNRPRRPRRSSVFSRKSKSNRKAPPFPRTWSGVSTRRFMTRSMRRRRCRPQRRCTAANALPRASMPGLPARQPPSWMAEPGPACWPGRLPKLRRIGERQ